MPPGGSYLKLPLCSTVCGKGTHPTKRRKVGEAYGDVAYPIESTKDMRSSSLGEGELGAERAGENRGIPHSAA